MSSFQSYAGTPGSEQAPNKSPSHVPDDFSTPNATVSTPIHQPPLSPYRDPSGNASEAPTPVRTPGAGAGAPADEEEESLRLALGGPALLGGEAGRRVDDAAVEASVPLRNNGLSRPSGADSGRPCSAPTPR